MRTIATEYIGECITTRAFLGGLSASSAAFIRTSSPRIGERLAVFSTLLRISAFKDGP